MSIRKKITVTVDGAGELLALGSACPDTEESYQNTSFTSYNGRVLAIVKAGKHAGTIRITASAEGAETEKAEIAVI